MDFSTHGAPGTADHGAGREPRGRTRGRGTHGAREGDWTHPGPNTEGTKSVCSYGPGGTGGWGMAG
eukprot:7795501-Alexandrium_andersonii.AAC.1